MTVVGCEVSLGVHTRLAKRSSAQLHIKAFPVLHNNLASLFSMMGTRKAGCNIVSSPCPLATCSTKIVLRERRHETSGESDTFRCRMVLNIWRSQGDDMGSGERPAVETTSRDVPCSSNTHIMSLSLCACLEPRIHQNLTIAMLPLDAA